MFEGLKRLFGIGSDAASSATTEVASSGSALSHPRERRPWEDRSLSPHDRFEAYKGFVHNQLVETAASFDRAREANDTGTQKEIMNSPETKKWMDEGAWLKTARAEEFCDRIDRLWIVPELLGKNFLGVGAWISQGIDVGAAPPIPESITRAFLESECPLHPGEKIKDTHLLVLIPKTVNGKPYSAEKLDELCVPKKGSANPLIYRGALWASSWKHESWATARQAASEWILIPKSDPDPSKVPPEKHFRTKTIAAQQQVHENHYTDYREAKACELMTAAVLHDLMNGEPRILGGIDSLRCEELNPIGGRVIVGSFWSSGVKVHLGHGDLADSRLGRALVRKLV